MQSTIHIVQITLSFILIVIILLQVKGQGVGLFGSGESSYRTRRGFEKTLFQFTVVLTVLFIVTSIMSVRLF